MSKSIRKSLEESLILGFLFVLEDPGWHFDKVNIGAEPSNRPLPNENYIGFRFLTYNQHTTGSTDTTNPDTPITDVASTIRLQSYGPRAFVWLDAFLQSLGDDEVLEFFRPLGFTVDPTGGGITDASLLLGGDEQWRGVAQVRVGCRSIRDRVITWVDTIKVDLTTQDPAGLHPDLNSVFSVDISETP